MSNSPIKPLGPRVVLEKNEDTKKAGSIILAPGAEAKLFYKILATGPGCKNVKIGDVVVINREAATDIKVEDREITIVKEDEILGVM
jgi:chaperonin GroES